MSVTEVTKMWSKDGGSSTSKKLDPNDRKWSFTEGYQVTCTPDTDTPTVMSAQNFGLPGHGDQHPSGIAAYVESLVPTRISPILYQVMVGYEGEALNPATVDVEWSDITTTEPIDRDWNGDAIVTANGEPVDGLSMDISDQICVIRRKFMTINTAAIAQYRRATNSDTFLGWPPGTARLVGFSAKNAFIYGAAQEQWDVTARIQFREPFANTLPAEAWYKRWRHEGLYILDGSTVRRATDDTGQDVAKPVLLKEDGTQETDPANAYFFHTQVYGSLPYSGLGLV